jgi:small-conductance mechanosensitive channel
MSFELEQLMQYGLDAVGILVMVVIGVVTFVLIRRGLAAAAAREKISESLRLMAVGFTKWAIVILVILLALQQAGFEVTSIWAGLLTIMAMVAVGFIAVWSVINNIFCALLMLVFSPFRIGDEIEIIEATGGKGLRGRILKVNLMFTSIDEIGESGKKGVIVQVPNNIFFQKTLRRKLGADTRSVDETFFEKPQDDQTS